MRDNTAGPVKFWAVLLAALFCLALAAPGWAAAPDFTLKDVQNGKTCSLSQFKGKVVLVNFFTFFCGPCREEMPHLNQMDRELKGQGFQTLGILGPDGEARILAGMDGLKARADTLEQLADNAMFYVRSRPLAIEDKAAKILTAEARALLGELARSLAEADWSLAGLEAAIRDFATSRGLKLGQIAQPLRAALTGSLASPGIFEVMALLGRAETLARLDDLSPSER